MDSSLDFLRLHCSLNMFSFYVPFMLLNIPEWEYRRAKYRQETCVTSTDRNSFPALWKKSSRSSLSPSNIPFFSSLKSQNTWVQDYLLEALLFKKTSRFTSFRHKATTEHQVSHGYSFTDNFFSLRSSKTNTDIQKVGEKIKIPEGGFCKVQLHYLIR